MILFKSGGGALLCSKWLRPRGIPCQGLFARLESWRNMVRNKLHSVGVLVEYDLWEEGRSLGWFALLHSRCWVL